jgi:AraC family transcriptional regulator
MNTECIYSIIHFIEKNYNKLISIEELEQVSFYSYRNIQRIFKNTCGETIGAFQKRLKVENSYKLILFTKTSLSQIALEVGFENSASFSKAFKQFYGISPKEARMNKPVLFQQNEMNPTISHLEIKPEIVYIPEVKIYYNSIQSHYENAEIESLWNKFMIHNFPDNTDFYGIIADEAIITDKLNCRYDAGATKQALVNKLPSKNILGGRYAKFIHHGDYDTIGKTYKQIYGNWILSIELEFSHLPIIEHYIKHSGNTESIENYITYILIPLKK